MIQWEIQIKYKYLIHWEIHKQYKYGIQFRDPIKSKYVIHERSTSKSKYVIQFRRFTSNPNMWSIQRSIQNLNIRSSSKYEIENTQYHIHRLRHRWQTYCTKAPQNKVTLPQLKRFFPCKKGEARVHIAILQLRVSSKTPIINQHTPILSQPKTFLKLVKLLQLFSSSFNYILLCVMWMCYCVLVWIVRNSLRKGAGVVNWTLT